MFLGELIKDALKERVRKELGNGHFAIDDTLFIKTQHPAYLNKKKEDGTFINLILNRIHTFKGNFTWADKLDKHPI